MKNIMLPVVIFALSGCSSKLVISDDPLSGVPLPQPELVRVITTTYYEPSPTAVDQERAKKICATQSVKEDFKFVPLGRVRYVNFDPSPFGKGEFKVEYADSGAAKSVSLNSDPTAPVEAAGGLLSTILPYLGKPQFEAALVAPAEDQRSENCLVRTSAIQLKKMSVEE